MLKTPIRFRPDP